MHYSDNWLHTDEWWEEDCDWAVPYLFFADEIRTAGKVYHFEENLKQAEMTVKKYHPGFAGLNPSEYSTG
jgi:hypothetical protein